MSSQKFKSLLLKANSGSSKRVTYKKMFITSSGTEYRLRPLSTSLIDPNEVPFIKIRLHGGYKHPNFEGDFSSNYRCIGKDCPMCADVKEIKKVEFKNQLPRDMRSAWKKEKNQYAVMWAVNTENDEITLVLVPDTDQFKKVKDESGEESWKKVNTTCQEILFNKLMNAAENGLDPFDYNAGNDIIIKSKKVDYVVHWDISVVSTKNAVTEEIKKKLQALPKLEDLYKKYTKEELEYIVKGKPYNKDMLKQKETEEKEETSEVADSISNESFSDSDSDYSSDDEALLSEDSLSYDDDDDKFDDLSESLRNILNK